MRLGARVLPRARVLANSRATAERARALGFCSVTTIPLGTRAFGPETPPETSGNFILFAGRLTRRKGFAWLATEVLPLLPPQITLLVAGTVWDEGERAALASGRVTYLGALDQKKLGVLMAEALCVVIPNIPAGAGHFEGFGLVAVEAAVAGGVVVASRIDGFTDSVLDGVTGFLVEPMSPTDWVNKITEVASWRPDVRRAFTERSSATARSYFAWERVAKQTVEGYRAAGA
jgi:glycosyltransferase involved in cell wall biosynthesis